MRALSPAERENKQTELVPRNKKGTSTQLSANHDARLRLPANCKERRPWKPIGQWQGGMERPEAIYSAFFDWKDTRLAFCLRALTEESENLPLFLKVRVCVIYFSIFHIFIVVFLSASC